MKTISKVLPVNGTINILHMFTLHQCRVFHILLSNSSSDWVSVLSHKICDEFSPRRILQNIFGSATCLSLLVCESVCPCDSPLSGQSLPWTATTAQQGSRCDAMSLNILLFFGLCVKFPCHLLSVRFVVVVVVTWPVVRPHDGLVLNAACDVKFKCDCWSLKKCCLCVLWCFKKYCPFMFIVCFEENQLKPVLHCIVDN